MKPAEQGVQLERQNYPSNSTCMDLDSATDMFARRTGVHLPPARQLLELRGSRGQEIPRSPASRQMGQPGDRQSRGWCEEGGAGHPLGSWSLLLELAAGKGGPRGSRNLEQGPPEWESSKSWLSTRILELPSITAVGAAVTTAAQTKEWGP